VSTFGKRKLFEQNVGAHRPSIKGTKLLFIVIKAIIIIVLCESIAGLPSLYPRPLFIRPFSHSIYTVALITVILYDNFSGFPDSGGTTSVPSFIDIVMTMLAQRRRGALRCNSNQGWEGQIVHVGTGDGYLKVVIIRKHAVRKEP